MSYAVIADNGGSNQKYRDVVGEVYTFPSNYSKILTEGTKFVYQRCGKENMKVAEPDNERLLDVAHYFGVAEIGRVKYIGEGLYEAEIINYKHFIRGVPFRLSDGSHFELGKGQFYRNGVRATVKEVYEAIVKASTGVIPITTPLADVTPIDPIRKQVPTKNTRKTGTNRSSVQFSHDLSIGCSSKVFAKANLMLVSAKSGYWLYVFNNNTYYKLAPLTKNKYNVGRLIINRGIKSKDPIEYDDRKYFIVHEDKYDRIQIGTLEIADDHIQFRGMKTSQKTIDVIKIPLSIAI